MKKATINKKYCVACGCCVKVCNKKAIKISQGMVAKIDETLCVGCGLCVKTCPASIIYMEVINEQ